MSNIGQITNKGWKIRRQPYQVTFLPNGTLNPLFLPPLQARKQETYGSKVQTSKACGNPTAKTSRSPKWKQFSGTRQPCRQEQDTKGTSEQKQTQDTKAKAKSKVWKRKQPKGAKGSKKIPVKKPATDTSKDKPDKSHVTDKGKTTNKNEPDKSAATIATDKGKNDKRKIHQCTRIQVEDLQDQGSRKAQQAAPAHQNQQQQSHQSVYEKSSQISKDKAKQTMVQQQQRQHQEKW